MPILKWPIYSSLPIHLPYASQIVLHRTAHFSPQVNSPIDLRGSRKHCSLRYFNRGAYLKNMAIISYAPRCRGVIVGQNLWIGPNWARNGRSPPWYSVRGGSQLARFCHQSQYEEMTWGGSGDSAPDKLLLLAVTGGFVNTNTRHIDWSQSLRYWYVSLLPGVRWVEIGIKRRLVSCPLITERTNWS